MPEKPSYEELKQEVAELKEKNARLETEKKRVEKILDRLNGVGCRIDADARIAVDKQAGQSLKKSEERLRFLVEASKDIIWAFDLTTMTFAYCSSSVENITGYSPQEIIGQNLDHLFTRQIREKIVDTIDEMVRCGKELNKIAMNMGHRHKTGRTVWLETNAVLLAESSGTPGSVIGVSRDISDRKRAEDALRKSEKRYRLLFDNTSLLISVFDYDGVCRMVNRKAASMFGVEPEQLVGKNFSDFHPQMGDEILRRIRQAIETGHSQYYEDEVDFPTGRRYVFSEGQPVANREGEFEAVQIITQDITGRKQAEAALFESERQKRLILDSTSEKVVYFTPDLRILWANRASARLSGKKEDDIAGRHCFEVWQQNSSPCSSCVVQNARDSKAPQQGEKQAPDGRIWSVRAYPVFDNSGHVESIVSFGLDITEQKRAEEERGRLTNQLQQAQKMEALGRMAGAVAHHFNNQLSVVMGHLELCRECVEDSALCDHLDEAIRASRRGAYISGRMLAYLGKKGSRKEMLDLSELCRQHLQILKNSSIAEGVSLETDLQAAGPNVYASKDDMQEALTGLILNSWEAIEDFSGKVMLRTRSLEASQIRQYRLYPADWHPSEDFYACLEVTDTGAGINSDNLERIFDPFFSTKFTGRGLGLPVVLGVARGNSGVVGVESEVGRGTRVCLFLPLAGHSF